MLKLSWKRKWLGCKVSPYQLLLPKQQFGRQPKEASKTRMGYTATVKVFQKGKETVKHHQNLGETAIQKPEAALTLLSEAYNLKP